MLKDISSRVSVGHVGITSRYYCDDEYGIPFIRSQNVRPGKMDFNNLKYITPEFHQKLKKSQLIEDDLLVVRVGANRGDTCIVPRGFEQLNCANIVFARPFEGISDYLNYYFQSQFCQKILNSLTTGSAQGVINTKSVSLVPIPIPPKNEQQVLLKTLERTLSIITSAEQNMEIQIHKIHLLRKIVLKQAFEGKLVPQDPNDEPASELLKKIKLSSNVC